MLAVPLSLLALAGAIQAPGGPTVISPARLAEQLGSPDLVLFHVGTANTAGTFAQGHIPGARFVNPFTDFAAPPVEGGLRLELPPEEQLTRALRSHGVTSRSRIVVYWSDGLATPAARLVFTLAYAGLGDRVAVLDGGLEAWKAAGGPLSTEAAAVTPGDVTPVLRPDLVADAAAVHRALGAAGVTLVDARTPDFHAGRETGQGRSGRIPGAANVPFTTILTEDGRFRDPAALRAAFEAAGAEPGSGVITYCHIGQQASLVWLAAHLAGYPARLYDGSFQDWARRTELPVEPGKGAPR